METKVFNLIILDESGSMERIKRQAVDGVNETIQSIRAANKEHPEQMHFVSLVTFNDNVKTVLDCRHIDLVKEIKDSGYMPDCCTALYDAMGMSLNALKNVVGDEDKVLVTIITDGMENASREFKAADIKRIVEELKTKGWVFAYIGADQDVERVASQIAIGNTMSFSACPGSTADMMNRERKSRRRFYDRISDGSFGEVDENMNFFSEDDK